MSLLVRKINKAKWLQNDIINGEDVSADAITNCIKTTSNTLSTWRIDTEAALDEAALAIVSSHQHLDTFDVVWVSQAQLETEGIRIQNTPGVTPIADLVDRHANVADLTYKSLGKVANCIVKCFLENKVRRYSVSQLKKLLRDAINSGKLQVERLEPSIADKL